MYMDDIKLFAKNENELEIYSDDIGSEFSIEKWVGIYSDDIGREFSIEKCAMLIMKSGKWQMTKGIKLPKQEKSEHSENSKCTRTWEYWKWTLSNKWRWKKRNKEWGNCSKQNFVAENSSKG